MNIVGQKIQECCEAFTESRNPHHDNESYMALIFVDENCVVTAGIDLPPLKYCPWCGREIMFEQGQAGVL